MLWKVAVLAAVALGASPGAQDVAAPDRLWDALVAPDAGKGYRAIRGLARSGDAAVRVLRDRLAWTDAGLGRLIDGLGSENVADRDAAAAGVEMLGGLAEGALRKAAQGALSLEARSRVDALIMSAARAALVPSGEGLRRLRACVALELIGTAEAVAALEAAAKSSPSERERRFIAGCLKRGARPAARTKAADALYELCALLELPEQRSAKSKEEWMSDVLPGRSGFVPTRLLERYGSDTFRLVLIEEPAAIAVPGDSSVAIHLLDASARHLGVTAVSVGNRRVIVHVSLDPDLKREDALLKIESADVLLREPVADRADRYSLMNDTVSLLRD